MAKHSIKDLLDNSDIFQDLKEAYAFMLLSKGYTPDEIKVLDDYVFLIRKKGFGELDGVRAISATEGTGNSVLKKRRKKNTPQNLVCLTSTSEVYNKKDHSLYSLNGKQFVTKGRFAWSVIKLYQQEFNPTYEEVEYLFNFKLNLLRNTIITESLFDNFKANKQKKFFYHESDMIESKEGIRYVVSSQWSLNKMDEIISFARSKGWTVKVVNPREMATDSL